MSKSEKEEEVKKYNLFPIELFKINLKEDINVDPIINRIYNIQQDSPERLGSSKGGWQSHRGIHFYPELVPLVKHISYFVNKIFSTQCRIKEMWGSIYSTNDYNNIHNHPSLSSTYHNTPLWSGIYYIQSFPNSGELNIHSHVNVSNYQTFPPSNGDLILFNSNTYHSVTPNLEKENRICIAFNLELL